VEGSVHSLAFGAGSARRRVGAGRVRGTGCALRKLLIIDHGKGYLTIYGNNESVLKQVGEPVRTGDAVATVGRAAATWNRVYTSNSTRRKSL